MIFYSSNNQNQDPVMNTNTELPTKGKKIEVLFRKPTYFLPTLNNYGGTRTSERLKMTGKKLTLLTVGAAVV